MCTFGLGRPARSSSRGGFTLMELLVAVGLMVILITAVVVVFVKSTQVFRKAESLMEIFQNARAAIGTVGREVAGSFPIDSNNQEFIIANPRSGAGTGTALQWELTSGSVNWTIPLVVTITQTAWVDPPPVGNTAAPRVIGAAKVLYRLRNDPTGLYRMTNTTVTLERVLLKPEKVAAYYNVGGSPNLIDTVAEMKMLNSAATEKIASRFGGSLTLQEDLCKFVRYQPTGTVGSFHVEYFFVDPTGNATNRFFAEPGVTKSSRSNYPVEPPQSATGDKNIVHFSTQNTTAFGGQPCFQNLPIGIRIKMQVVDDQSNEVRTVARDIWIPAARTE